MTPSFCVSTPKTKTSFFNGKRHLVPLSKPQRIPSNHVNPFRSFGGSIRKTITTAISTEKGSSSLYAGSQIKPPLQGKHFLHVNDFTREEVSNMITLAEFSKAKFKARDSNFKPFREHSLAMIFEKPSARTRISFETGFARMGGVPIYLDPQSIQIGKREATKDIARVLSGFNDVILARLFAHENLLELAEYSDVPVVNGLTDYNHPCQIVADLLTIVETFGGIDGRKIAYVGDGNNIVHSWLELASLFEFEFVCVCPKGYKPDSVTLNRAIEAGRSQIWVTSDVNEGVKGADVIYTDVWASMGQKEQAERRQRDFQDFQVTTEMMGKTKESSVFMHCLPAERGRECEDAVIESPRSVVFQQAENRMHAQNGILLHIMEKHVL